MSLPKPGEPGFVQCRLTWGNGKPCTTCATRRHGASLICHLHVDHIDKGRWPDPRKPRDVASRQLLNEVPPFDANVPSNLARVPTASLALEPLPTTSPPPRWSTQQVSVVVAPNLSALLVDSEAACLLLGIKSRYLWSLTNRKAIPSQKVGRLVLYCPDELRAWIRCGCPTKAGSAAKVRESMRKAAE